MKYVYCTELCVICSGTRNTRQNTSYRYKVWTCTRSIWFRPRSSRYIVIYFMRRAGHVALWGTGQVHMGLQ